MNFINRAIKNIQRRLSKTVMLTLTFFLIGNFVIIGLGVSSAAENAKLLTRKKMSAVVFYELDYQKIALEGDKIQDENERELFYKKIDQLKHTTESVGEILKDERVKAISSPVTTIATTDKINTNHIPSKFEEELEANAEQEVTENGNITNIGHSYDISIKSNITNKLIEFEEKGYSLVSGRMYSEDEIKQNAPVALVSQKFAEHNNLTLGSKIYLIPHNGEVDYMIKDGLEGFTYELKERVVEFEVIGIYNHNLTINPDEILQGIDNPDNNIFTPIGSVEKATLEFNKKFYEFVINQEGIDEYRKEYLQQKLNSINEGRVEDLYYLSTLNILLKDPLDIDKFVEDYSDKNTFFKATVNNEEFKKFSKPLETISIFSNIIIILVVVNAIVIISLVTALTLKTREYEIGVLLSIGSSKFKIISQFFVELVLVALIAFSFATLTGVLVSKQVGDKVLEYTISSQKINEENDMYYYPQRYTPYIDDYTTRITLEDVTSEYNVTVQIQTIATLYATGVMIVLISVLIPSIMIMRYNPKKILMSTN